MEMFMDDKWKLSKKSSRRSASGGASPGSVSGRLARLAKEQKARFYIMRRCVTMLVCWRD